MLPNDLYETTIHWSDPEPILTYLDKIEKYEEDKKSWANHRGVYFLLLQDNKQLVPYYIGQADYIPSRTSQHIAKILSGQYTIFHTSSLFEFSKFKNAPHRVYANEGKLYEPHWPNSLAHYLKHKTILQPHIDFMLASLVVSWATVPKNMDLKDVEGTCIRNISSDEQTYFSGKDRLINSKINGQKLTLDYLGIVSQFYK